MIKIITATVSTETHYLYNYETCKLLVEVLCNLLFFVWSLGVVAFLEMKTLPILGRIIKEIQNGSLAWQVGARLNLATGAVFQIGVGHRPMADKNWKWPILSERSGQNRLSKLKIPAQMAYHFYGILATAGPCMF